MTGRAARSDAAAMSPVSTIQDPLAGHISMLAAYSDRDIHNVTAYPGDAQMKRPDRASARPRDGSGRRRVPGRIGFISWRPGVLRKPLAESWPTYSGDYTGRRFSALTQVNRTTVKNLSLAWVSRVARARVLLRRVLPGAPPHP